MFVRLCTCGVVAVLLAVLLPVCVLLRVLQTQFVTHLERLADCADNAHGLALGGRERKDKQKSKCICNSYNFPLLCCHLVESPQLWSRVYEPKLYSEIDRFCR